MFINLTFRGKKSHVFRPKIIPKYCFATKTRYKDPKNQWKPCINRFVNESEEILAFSM